MRVLHLFDPLKTLMYRAFMGPRWLRRAGLQWEFHIIPDRRNHISAQNIDMARFCSPSRCPFFRWFHQISSHNHITSCRCAPG